MKKFNSLIIITTLCSNLLMASNETIKEKNISQVDNKVETKITKVVEKEQEEFIEKDGFQCIVENEKNLNDIKAKCYVQHNKKQLFGIISDKILVSEYYTPLFPDINSKTTNFKSHCDDVFIKLKKEFLEGSITKCELEIDGNKLILPNNSLEYSLGEIQNILHKEESSFKIDNLYSKSFKLEFNDEEFLFTIVTKQDFTFDKSDLEKRFAKLPLYKKYLVIYNGEINHLGIETSMKIEVLTKSKIPKVLGIIKNLDEDEILLLEKNTNKESLKINILSKNEFTMNKLFIVNRTTQEMIDKYKLQIVNNAKRGYEQNKPKLSFVSNKQNNKQEYSKFNNKTFLNLVLETHKNNWFDKNYELETSDFKISLIPIKK